MLEIHMLASGSSGNCSIVEYDDDAIMIDAGISYKRIKSLMELAGIEGHKIKSLLITHEHMDHIYGAGATARALDVPIMTNIPTFKASNLGDVRFTPISKMLRFSVGSIMVTSIPTSHDAVDPCCYFIETDKRKALIVTDTGVVNPKIEFALRESNIAILESNYDPKMLMSGPYPAALKRRIMGDTGHLSNYDCANLIKHNMINKKIIFLAHISRKNNTPDIARQTVSDLTGISRSNIDCMEFPGDIRTIRAWA